MLSLGLPGACLILSVSQSLTSALHIPSWWPQMPSNRTDTNKAVHYKAEAPPESRSVPSAWSELDYWTVLIHRTEQGLGTDMCGIEAWERAVCSWVHIGHSPTCSIPMCRMHWNLFRLRHWHITTLAYNTSIWFPGAQVRWNSHI